MVWCDVVRTGFGGPLCAKKSRATLWPQSAPAQKFTKTVGYVCEGKQPERSCMFILDLCGSSIIYSK